MLIASIAHEINQPLAAIVTNADAGLRWLSGNERNLHETEIRQSFGTAWILCQDLPEAFPGLRNVAAAEQHSTFREKDIFEVRIELMPALIRDKRIVISVDGLVDAPLVVPRFRI